MIDAFGVEISKGLPSYLRQANSVPKSGYARLRVIANKKGKASSKAFSSFRKAPGRAGYSSYNTKKYSGKKAAKSRREIEGTRQRPLRNI